MLDTRKHGQFVVDVISEMLDETKRVAEDCSVGTAERENFLRMNELAISFEKELTSERMPKIIVPERYRNEIQNEILNESKEFISNQSSTEIAMRDLFRSVWDTVCCVNSLAEIFVNNPALISTRNIYVMQRDLIDKIIDIPFIHRNDKSRQYLEFRTFVDAPRKLSSFLLGNMKYSLEELTVSTIRGGLEDVLKLLVRYQFFCEHINGDREAVSELISDFTDLHDNIEKLCKDLSDKNLRKKVNAKLRRAENLFLELYTKRYHPDKDITELSNKELKSWIDVEHPQKLKEGLLQYIDDDFYSFNALGFKTSEMKEWCDKLPTMYNRCSLYVHDFIGNPTYTEQKWAENPKEYVESHVLEVSATALYVAATHFYHCAGISRDSDEMKSLQRMFREIQNI